VTWQGKDSFIRFASVTDHIKGSLIEVNGEVAAEEVFSVFA